jgi:hypothetical protein
MVQKHGHNPHKGLLSGPYTNHSGATMFHLLPRAQCSQGSENSQNLLGSECRHKAQAYHPRRKSMGAHSQGIVGSLHDEAAAS